MQNKIKDQNKTPNAEQKNQSITSHQRNGTRDPQNTTMTLDINISNTL